MPPELLAFQPLPPQALFRPDTDEAQPHIGLVDRPSAFN